MRASWSPASPQTGTTQSSSWDDTVFEHPEELDVHRTAQHHLAFGYGIHQCLGQNLARAELEIVFGTLLRRVPNLAMAVPTNELSYRDDSSVYGVNQLPVTCN